MTRKDIYLGALIGFLFGLLLALPAKNLNFAVTPTLLFLFAAGFAVFAPFTLFLLYELSRFWKVLYQFGKFAAVGALNTLIDLGVLNLLILVAGLSTGPYFSLFKAVSFLVAVTNSYFWNKLWTFGIKTPTNFNEYGRFLLATLVGLIINVGVASLIVAFFGEAGNSKLWANIGALIAVFASLLWNFIAYKYIVFKVTDEKPAV